MYSFNDSCRSNGVSGTSTITSIARAACRSLSRMEHSSASYNQRKIAVIQPYQLEVTRSHWRYLLTRDSVLYP